MLTGQTRHFGRTAVFASLTVLALGALTSTAAEARPRHWHGGGAAAAAGIAAAVGTGLAIAASRDAYDYYDGPAYGPGPVYYGGPTYYSYPAPYGYYRSGQYPYQVYGGDSPYTACAQVTTWNCR
jgi:hypothetical protein